MPSFLNEKIKLDFSVNQNIYYRAGIFFITISLFISLLTRLNIIGLEWKQLRAFPIYVGIPFYLYGVYTHYVSTKDKSFIKQTFSGFLIGFLIIILVYLFK